jgi:hypothetical protein
MLFQGIIHVSNPEYFLIMMFPLTWEVLVCMFVVGLVLIIDLTR